MEKILFEILELGENVELSQSKRNPTTSLIQKKYAAVRQVAQGLLNQNLIEPKTSYEDLNCGKLVKMINFRVKEILVYAEWLGTDQNNKLAGSCKCCQR